MIVIDHYPRAGKRRAKGAPDAGDNQYVGRHRLCVPSRPGGPVHHPQAMVMVGAFIGWQCLSCGVVTS